MWAFHLGRIFVQRMEISARKIILTEIVSPCGRSKSFAFICFYGFFGLYVFFTSELCFVTGSHLVFAFRFNSSLFDLSTGSAYSSWLMRITDTVKCAWTKTLSAIYRMFAPSSDPNFLFHCPFPLVLHFPNTYFRLFWDFQSFVCMCEQMHLLRTSIQFENTKLFMHSCIRYMLFCIHHSVAHVFIMRNGKLKRTDCMAKWLAVDEEISTCKKPKWNPNLLSTIFSVYFSISLSLANGKLKLPKAKSIRFISHQSFFLPHFDHIEFNNAKMRENIENKSIESKIAMKNGQLVSSK